MNGGHDANGRFSDKEHGPKRGGYKTEGNTLTRREAVSLSLKNGVWHYTPRQFNRKQKSLSYKRK